MICGATAFAASPPDAFMDEKIICVFNGGVGDGGTATTREFVEVGLNPGKWSKASDSQWIYNVKTKDPVTNKKSDVAFSFIKMAKLPNVEDSGVVLERVVENKTDLPPINVYNLCRQIYYSLPSLKAAEKKAIEKAKVAKAKVENKQLLVEKLQEEEQLTQIQKEKEQELEEITKAKRKSEANERIRIAESKAREETAQKRKELKQEKESSEMKRITGHYENQQGKGQVLGTLDVTLTEGKTIKFNLYNKLGYAACKIEGQEAKLEYDERGGFKAIYGEVPKSRVKSKKNDDSCSIEMEFKEISKSVKELKGFDFQVDIKPNGCKQFCERGGTFMGNYWKVADEPRL